MQTRTVDQIQGWSSRPFSSGYGGLHELAAAGFSGAVSADGAWLFMLNGHAIGVAEGTVETFEGASGTAYSAPDDALPLLFAMVERGGEKRGQYYTERTPLSEVDKTLSQGGFTGYVELSENVLSGDYYVVYYGGNPMHAAFVGQSERTLTGEEAHERAADEVGLYDVVAVDLSILDLPDPPEDSAVVGGGAVAAGDATNGTATDRPIDESTVDDPGDEAAGAPSESSASEPSPSETAPSEPSPSATESAGDLDLESTLTGGSAADETPPPEADAPMDDAATPDRPEPAPEPEEAGETAAAESETVDTSTVDRDEGVDPEEPERTPEGDSTDRAVAASLDDVELADSATTEEPAPSEDPTPPEDPAASEDLATAVEEVETEEEPPTTPEASTDAESTPGGSAENRESAGAEEGESASELDDLFAGTEEPGADHEFAGATRAPAVEEDRVRGSEDNERVAELEERLRALDVEREELAEERADLVEERDRLRARVAELETEVAASTLPADFEQVSPQAALEATDLFVRYRSKSAATLEDAHAGADNHDAVRQNLDLEHHTRFDATRTAVDDEEYEQFLPATLEHDLTTWLVADLLYEIRDTGHVDGLRPLYDALPRIDRADLYGSVEVSGEKGADSVAFDMVCRDRLGNPLVCLDVHDSREPATDGEMDAVLQKSARVGEDHDEFACAFLVTSSFFEPSALELATDRTASGGLFGGSKRESFVKLSRKRGYHLCLVEARDRRFHLTLPEL